MKVRADLPSYWANGWTCPTRDRVLASQKDGEARSRWSTPVYIVAERPGPPGSERASMPRRLTDQPRRPLSREPNSWLRPPSAHFRHSRVSSIQLVRICFTLPKAPLSCAASGIRSRRDLKIPSGSTLAPHSTRCWAILEASSSCQPSARWRSAISQASLNTDSTSAPGAPTTSRI